MVFGAVLAGGIGSRMGNSDTPTQYIELGSKPIIIHTIEKFFVHPDIDEIIVLCPKPWVLHTRDLVKKFLSQISRAEPEEWLCNRRERKGYPDDVPL